MAQARATAALTLRERVVSELSAASADSTSWEGLAGDAVRGSIDELQPEFSRLVQQFEHDAAALSNYAGAVESIAQDARSLRVREHDTRDALLRVQARGRLLEQDPGAIAELQTVEYRVRVVAAELAALEREWDDLAQRRQAADAACTTALSSVASRGGFAALPSHGDVDGLTDAQLVAMLLGLSGAELLALLGSDPSLPARIAAMDDADAVARWWRSLAEPVTDGAIPVPSEVQRQLLEDYPEMLGNLDGVWFGHRDIANRIVFERDIARMDELMEQYYALMHTFSNSSEYDSDTSDFVRLHGFDSEAEFAAAYADLVAIRKTLAAAPPGSYPPYQFVLYEPGTPMLAAVSVGDMDTASQVTSNVPGMGSEVARSLQEWTGVAENLWAQQTAANALHGGAENGLAVVAWIGYDAPDMPPSPQVFSSENARDGAENLVGFLEGITAVRQWDAGQNLSVVGHSYGTTTATLALAETPVEHLVMLGSAGIDSSIPNVDDLMVDPDNVWASEALGDVIADLGRGDLQSLPEIETPFGTFTAPFVLHWDVPTAPWYDHPVNPISDGYGANVFSSEGAYANGAQLQAADVHDGSPQELAQINGTETNDYGYFDWGTTPLVNSALLSLGIHQPVGSVGVSSGGGGV